MKHMTHKFNQGEQLVWLVKNCNTRKAGTNSTSTWHKREACSLIQGYSESTGLALISLDSTQIYIETNLKSYQISLYGAVL